MQRAGAPEVSVHSSIQHSLLAGEATQGFRNATGRAGKERMKRRTHQPGQLGATSLFLLTSRFLWLQSIPTDPGSKDSHKPKTNLVPSLPAPERSPARFSPSPGGCLPDWTHPVQKERGKKKPSKLRGAGQDPSFSKTCPGKARGCWVSAPGERRL